MLTKTINKKEKMKKQEISKKIIKYDLVDFLQRNHEWSERTFGPGERTQPVVAHIRKELEEILAAPRDISEWIDVVILAFNGVMRQGFTAEQVANALSEKQIVNEGRKWPDWRQTDPTKPTEHLK